MRELWPKQNCLAGWKNLPGLFFDGPHAARDGPGAVRAWLDGRVLGSCLARWGVCRQTWGGTSGTWRGSSTGLGLHLLNFITWATQLRLGFMSTFWKACNFLYKLVAFSCFDLDFINSRIALENPCSSCCENSNVLPNASFYL